MKQLLVLGVALTLLGGCSQPTPSSGVSQPGQNSSAESVFPENTETVVLKVPGMNWAFSWAPVVRKALEALPGVAQVTTDVDAQTATCSVDKEKFDAEKAIAALAEVGYDSTVQE